MASHPDSLGRFYACQVEDEIGDRPYVWLTTVGRRTGKQRTVELWFVLADRTIFVLAGGGDDAHWVRNARATSDVTVRLGQRTYHGVARWPERGSPEDHRARRAMAAKYQGWREGRPLSSWARDALCMAVDLVPGA